MYIVYSIAVFSAGKKSNDNSYKKGFTCRVLHFYVHYGRDDLSTVANYPILV